jgi:hypothetical protein
VRKGWIDEGLGGGFVSGFNGRKYNKTVIYNNS